MMRRTRVATAGFALLGLFGTSALNLRSSSAITACEDLTGNAFSTAEMWYSTNSGTDVCYANAYGDTGDQLSWSGGLSLAAVPSGSQVHFRAMALAHDEVTSDCTDVTFRYTVTRGTFCQYQSGNWSAISNPTNAIQATLRINSCLSTQDNIWAGKQMNVTQTGSSVTTLSYLSRAEIDTANGCNSLDYGCNQFDADFCDSLINL